MRLSPGPREGAQGRCERQGAIKGEMKGLWLVELAAKFRTWSLGGSQACPPPPHRENWALAFWKENPTLRDVLGRVREQGCPVLWEEAAFPSSQLQAQQLGVHCPS